MYSQIDMPGISFLQQTAYNCQPLSHVIGSPVSEYYELIRLPPDLRSISRFGGSASYQRYISGPRRISQVPDASLSACHGLMTPTAPHILTSIGCFMLASCSLTHWPTAIDMLRCCTSTSGSAVSLAACRILCVHFVCFVHPEASGLSATNAILDTGDWLGLAR
jgi:hypothetical protein